MNKKKLNKIKALIISSLLLTSSSMAFANDMNQQDQLTQTTQGNTTQSNQGVVRFVSEYDVTITPQQGDVFVITYGLGDNQAQMEIDASLIASSPKDIEMPNTTYTIFNIEAKSGTRNEAIPYAVNNQFTVSLDSNAEIRIYVGENSVNTAVSLAGENNLLIKNYTIIPTTPSIEPSIEPSYDVPSLTAPSIEIPSDVLSPSSTLVEYPSDDNTVDNPSIDETSNDEEKPSEKTEEEIAAEKAKYRKSLINRGIIFLVLAGISLAGLFFGHKMGKF